MAHGRANPSVESARGTGGLATLISRHSRNMIAFHLLMGRRVQSLASELLRRLLDCVAWLNKPLSLVGPRVKLGVAWKHWHAVMGLFLGGVSVRFMVQMYLDSKSGRRGRRRLLRQKMMEAETYEDWKRCASALEKVDEKRIEAVEKLQNQLYDTDLIQGRVEYLRRIRERGDPYELMFVVRADLIRNMGNIADASLHCRLSSVPKPIHEYILQVKYCLRDISNAASVPVEERLAFLRETRHAFGRTALVLSGGGSFGSFHLGVIKALLDASLLPRVLSGSSAGAIVVALVGTRTRSELKELFSSLDETLKGIDFYSYNTAVQLASHLLLKGTLQDYRVLQDRLQKLLGEYTFEEAYARSGIALNVAVSAADTTEPPRLLNYLTAPNVLVWSAVACSSAFPFLFAPQTLLARDSKGRIAPFANKSAGESQRRWRDGSLEEDLPMRGLSEMFNVNYFLVSQCNPYLLPIIAAKESVPRTIGVLIEQEFKHRCQQLMELMPRKLGASKLLKLLSQPWEGDVTMVLPVTTLSTLKSVINLSKDDVMLAKWEGQRATWRKLAAIATNCDIEVTLDECLRQVTAKARRKKAKQAGKPDSNAEKNGKRIHNIPSWLHLQSLGIPHADSFEKLGMMQSQIDLAVSRARSQASSSGIHLSDIMTSSVPDRLDEYDLEDDTEAYPTFEDAVPVLPENRKPDKDTWKNLFQVAPTTMSSYAIDLIAP